MPVEIWGVRVQEDVTAVTAKMASSVDHLNNEVGILGRTFKATNTGALNIGLKEARMLFYSAGQNAKLFKAALKDAGVSALDSRLLLNKFNAEMVATRRHALGLEGVLARAFSPRAIWHLSHALNVASKGYGAISAIAGVGGAVAGKAYDLGKQGISSVIDAASLRQNSISAMSYMYENPRVNQKQAEKWAGEDFRWAQRLAKDTPLDTPEVIQAMTQFTTAQYDRREAKILTTLAADQASKFKNQPEMMGNVISAFNRIRGQGTSSRDLTSLRVAGFNVEKIIDEMIKLPEMKKHFTGLKKDANPEERKKAAKKALSTGMVSWQSLTQAAINSVEFEKPNIGVMAGKMGKESLEGSISNFQNAWGDLIASVDSEKWYGIQQFIKFLNRVSNALDGDTESGKRLVKIVNEAVDNLLGGLVNIDDDIIERTFTTLAYTARDIAKWLGEAWGWFERMMRSDLSFVDTMIDGLIDVGFWIGKGLLTGVVGGYDELTADRYEKKHGIKQGLGQYHAKQTGLDPNSAGIDYRERVNAFERAGKKVDYPWYAMTEEARQSAAYTQVMDWSRANQGAGLGVVSPASSTPFAEGELQKEVYGKMYQVGVWGGQGMYDGAVAPEALDAHSPSRRMMEVGQMAADGLVKGTEGGLGRGGLGGAPQLNLTIHVQGGGSAAADWQALKPDMERELTSFFVRKSMEG